MAKNKEQTRILDRRRRFLLRILVVFPVQECGRDLTKNLGEADQDSWRHLPGFDQDPGGVSRGRPRFLARFDRDDSGCVFLIRKEDLILIV